MTATIGTGTLMKRRLGQSGIEVSAMGLGCWAIGGPFWMDGKADGWGDVDDDESCRAIHCALDLGVNFFDTSDAYGTGHSERVLGQALKERRSQAVIATKFGYTYNESTRHLTGSDVSPKYIRRACEASLARLQTDYIDLYQLHVGEIPPEEAPAVVETLEQLQREGLIRSYGWSTDNVDCARLFLGNPHFVSVQAQLNVMQDAAAMLDFCEANSLATICRSPLGMGFLTGKFNRDSQLSTDDVRGAGHEWVDYFENGRPRPEFLKKLEDVREVLTSGGRTLTQGALAWLWGRSSQTIPIPGFKSVKQVEENARALEFGALTAVQVEQIHQVLMPG